MILGCHLSNSTYMKMVKDAEILGINTFQCFSRSPYGGELKALNKKDIDEFNKYCLNNDFGPILVHSPFVTNSASNKPEIRELAKNIIHEDLKRLDYLNNSLYVFHPGCHMKQGVDFGLEKISEILNFALYENQKTIVLLETMAGKGTELGKTFEELKTIIDNVNLKDKVGVCLDTCHIWDGGYDIENNLDEVIDKFDEIIGLNYLKAIHLNNSLNDCGSHKDKHASIIEGKINKETFIKIINHERLKDIPFYLETPVEKYQLDIYFLKNN